MTICLLGGVQMAQAQNNGSTELVFGTDGNVYRAIDPTTGEPRYFDSSASRDAYIVRMYGKSNEPAAPAASSAVVTNDGVQLPLFRGSANLSTFGNWVGSNVIYPAAALELGIEGRVEVKFVVGIDGTVSSVEVVGEADPLLAVEAVRVVGLSPLWTPGMKDGLPVRVSFSLPVDFKLPRDDEPATNVENAMRQAMQAVSGSAGELKVTSPPAEKRKRSGMMRVMSVGNE